MTPRDTFNAIKAKEDGPIKKFELIKIFGKALRQDGCGPDKMSCAELELAIEAILNNLEWK